MTNAPCSFGDQSPRIVAFACRWCALLGAERVGRERLPLPDGLRIVPINCAGSVSLGFILRALEDGVDGVAVLGCHLGGCRHNEANRTAHARLLVLGDLLAAAGVDERRLLVTFGTAHEADPFARTLHDFALALQAARQA